MLALCLVFGVFCRMDVLGCFVLSTVRGWFPWWCVVLCLVVPLSRFWVVFVWGYSTSGCL